MDCMNVLKSLSDESVSLVITDPPYPTTKRGISKNTTTGGMVRSELGKQGKMFKYNNIDVSTYIPEFFRILKDGSHLYIMTNHVNLQKMINTCTSIGFHFIKSLIWDKGNKIMGQYYMSQFEYILFFRKGKGVKINNCGTSDILSIPNKKTKDKDGKNLHDTEKPVELMKILIENSTKPYDIIVDPFVGVGAVALAAMQSNRKFVCCEIDNTYCDITKNRIFNYIS